MIQPTDAKVLAKRREDAHVVPRPNNWYGEGNSLGPAAIVAERAFARTFGLFYDEYAMTERPEGDGGIDFAIPIIGRTNPLTVDVKAATKAPWSLLVNERVIRHVVDIYVLYAVRGEQAVFVGWERYGTMLEMPVMDYGYGPGSLCRIRKREHLRPINSLCDILAHRVDVEGPR